MALQSLFKKCSSHYLIVAFFDGPVLAHFCPFFYFFAAMWVTTFHRSGQNEPSKSFELFECFVNRPEHGTVVTTAKTTVPCPSAPSSLSDGGMLFLSQEHLSDCFLFSDNLHSPFSIRIFTNVVETDKISNHGNS